MPNSRNLAWLTYAAFLFLLITKKVYHATAADSPSYIYYYFLKAFNPIFMWPYFFNCIQIVLNIVHLAPLVLYIYNTPFLSRRFWQALLIARLVFDLLGHSYEMQTLASFFHDNLFTFAYLLIQFAAPYIPSYIACYRYAFARSFNFPK